MVERIEDYDFCFLMGPCLNLPSKRYYSDGTLIPPVDAREVQQEYLDYFVIADSFSRNL
jgi:hypothetical protein